MRSRGPQVLKSVSQVRTWRQERLNQSVGFVPTMGALHDGHMSLVTASKAANDCTIASIFVNPTQFAPHEDLATYPRTFDADFDKLSTHEVDALFLPPVEALYPGGVTQEVASQVGTFVEVKGLQDSMEGASRPGFFRGVATVVAKLFNIVQPTRAYFGQKDIQQALLLRRMLRDLHFSAPQASDLVIVETSRDVKDRLALSSRNAYLSPAERAWAPVLIDALETARRRWTELGSKQGAMIAVDDVLAVAREHCERVSALARAATPPVHIAPLYIALNEPKGLTSLQGQTVPAQSGALLSGAVMLGKTRLIDNLAIGIGLNDDDDD